MRFCEAVRSTRTTERQRPESFRDQHLTRKIRKALGEEVPIVARMDAGFCDKKIYRACEELGIGYLSSGRLLEERSCRCEGGGRG